MGTANRSSIFLKPIELHEILDLIKSICLRKAKGYDGITPKIVKWASDLLAPILLTIFNKCIEIGHYPGDMKIGEVAPVFKKRKKRNYSLLGSNNLFNHSNSDSK